MLDWYAHLKWQNAASLCAMVSIITISGFSAVRAIYGPPEQPVTPIDECLARSGTQPERCAVFLHLKGYDQ